MKKKRNIYYKWEVSSLENELKVQEVLDILTSMILTTVQKEKVGRYIMRKSELTNQKIVAIYARVSTTEQAEEGYSIDEQIRVLNELCEREGYFVYEEYIDRGISGKTYRVDQQYNAYLWMPNRRSLMLC